MHRPRFQLFILFAALSPFLLVASAFAQVEHKRVLALHATRRDSEFALIAESRLPQVLDVRLGRNLDYYSEFLDESRFPEPSYEAAFADYLRRKYGDVRFDLVIAFHDSAVNFVDKHRSSLFADTPEVFLANVRPVRRSPGTTGLIHERDFASTLALVQQLQPEVTDVFVVTGAAAADHEYEEMVRRQVASADLKLKLTYLSGLPTADLETRLASLPPRSAVYYLLVTEYGEGNKFHPLQYGVRVATAANAPTYCWVDSAIDLGIVGGSLYSQSAVIDRVGDLALRVLRGESPDSIPLAVVSPSRNQVDWRQVQRWGIDEARLPAGTLVMFRQPTIWDRYKAYILVTIATLLTQTALISGLLIQRKRRRRAEAQLLQSETDLRSSYQRIRFMGSRLLRAQETERSRIARELHDDICQRMLLLTIALQALRGSEADGAIATGALTQAQGIAKSLHELSHQLHPTRLRLLGLVDALDRLRVEISRATIPIAFTHEHVPSTLPSEVMLCLFRVAQETLQNAIKHSGATELSIHLSGGRDGLALTVADNGTGFDTEAAWQKGVGLLSMVERLEAIGGSLEIRSAIGAGTSVTASVPLPALVVATAP